MAEEPLQTLRTKVQVRKLQKAYAADHAPRCSLAFLLQDWTDPYNVGGMFRVGDACGCDALVLTGRTPQPPHPQIHVTSMGNHRRVSWRYEARWEDAALSLKAAGYTLVGVELAEGAVPYTEFPFSGKVALALGNEQQGLYPGVLKHCEAAVFVPMAGKGRSLNVHVSAAVVAFWARFGKS